MLQNIKLGTAKVDITPSHPVPLAGFAHRKGNLDGVARRLYAKIFFFQQQTGDGEHLALLVQADLIWWDTEQLEELRRQLQERWGFNPESVIFHASHTHSGPQTSGRFTPSLGMPDPDYLRILVSRLLDGISKAQSNAEPVQIEKGVGECRIGVHRRKFVNGDFIMAPNPDGPVDTEVNVFRFRTASGETKGIWFHYACHPTTTGDNLVSSEFPGAAMDKVEEALGGALASYLQGCCGDIRPALFRDDKFYRGTEADIDRLGKALADEVLRVLERPMMPLPPCLLEGQAYTVRLPFQQPPPTAEKLLLYSQKEGITGEWSRLLLDEPYRIRSEIPLELSVLHIACGLSFLTMNGEVVVDYGLFVKRMYGGRVLPLSYSNGMIGYIPTAKQVSEGGYEGKESALFFGLPGPFDASLERLIHGGIIHLIGR